MTPEIELLRSALLRLHGLLLQAERRERERGLGPLSNQAWFGAALGDPTLAWLRPASRLVSAIDQAGAVARRTGVAPSEETVREWLKEARAFATPGARYREWLQGDPDIVLAHRDVVRALPPPAPKPADHPGIEVLDNVEEQRFEFRGPGGLAFAAYRLKAGAIVLTHTEVPEAHESQGVGSALVRHALDSARAGGLHVVPLCPFVAAYIEHHPEYADLIRG